MNIRRILGLEMMGLGALVLLLQVAGAWAQEPEGAARRHGECREARRVCHHAARTAQRVCRDACTSDESGASCRDECRYAFHQARTLCREEIGECLRAQLPPLDEECAAECREDFFEEHQHLHECHRDCAANTRDAIDECRYQLGGAPDSEGYRECVRTAHIEGRLCAQDCHDAFSCSGELRECLSSCVIGE